jgi:hypothetical protein
MIAERMAYGDSAPIRKLGQLIGKAHAWTVDQPHLPDDRPSILCNSVPKAGTHLLAQITRRFADIDLGRMAATYGTSFNYSYRPASAAQTFIQSLLPGEHARAHFDYSELLLDARVAVVTIVRHPMDLLVSEASYIRDQNRFHLLHPLLAAEPDISAAQALILNGALTHVQHFGRRRLVELPPLAARLDAYVGWASSHHGLVVRYEDLAGVNGPETQLRCLDSLSKYAAERGLRAPVAADLLSSISRSRSHTARSSDRVCRAGLRLDLKDSDVRAFKRYCETYDYHFGVT